MPYTRVNQVTITNSVNGGVTASVEEELALMDAKGNAYCIQIQPTPLLFSPDQNDNTTQIQLYSPTTGEAIPGQFMTPQQIMLGIYAAIHAQQLLRDANTASAA